MAITVPLLDKKDSSLIVASWLDFTRKQSCNMEPTRDGHVQV